MAEVEKEVLEGFKLQAPKFEDSDEENYTVYNIIEETPVERHDPLLTLKPVVYTTKLDDMNTFRKDLTNMKPYEILREVYDESKPMIEEKSAKRASNPENYIESFSKLASIINGINLKTIVPISQDYEIESNPSSNFDESEQEIMKYSSNDIKFDSLINNVSEVSDNLVKVKPEISTSVVYVAPTSDTLSEIHPKHGKEFSPCYVLLNNIGNKITPNQTIKVPLTLNSLNKYEIVNTEDRTKNMSQVEVKEEQTDLESGLKTVSDETQINSIINENVEQELESRKLIPTNNTNSSVEDSHIQNKETADMSTDDESLSNISIRKRRKRKLNMCIKYESSSDEDYVPCVNLNKKTTPNTSKPHISEKNNICTAKVPDSNLNKKSKVISDKPDLPSKNNNSTSVANLVSKSSNNVTNTSNITTITADQTAVQEKYSLIVLSNKKKEASVYRVNFLKLITDYYFIKDCEEFRLAAMYPKEEKIIEEYCCWYKREEIVGKICSRKSYPFTIQKILKQTHPCNNDECQCCCRFKTGANNSGQVERRDLIDKSITGADNWVRDMLNKTKTTSACLVDKALSYTPKADKEKPVESQSEKYLENCLLCLKTGGTATSQYELYDIGKNGNVVGSHLQFKENEVAQIRKSYQMMSMPIRDAKICCWFRREKLMQELKALKASPVTLKFVQKAHNCSNKICSCCCKPFPVTLRGVNIMPPVLKQTTAYERIGRPITIEFNTKSKNAMLKSKYYNKSQNKTIKTNASTAAVVLSECAFKDDNPLLSITIMNKFKNLKLGINNDGKLEVILDDPAKNLSIAELKTLSDILALSTKQMTELKLSAEEFCNRINTKSGNVIRVATTVAAPMVSTETLETSLLHDDLYDMGMEDNNIKIQNENIKDNLKKEDDVENAEALKNTKTMNTLNKQTSLSSKMAGTMNASPTRQIKSNVSSSETTSPNLVWNMLKSNAGVMESKNKINVDSCKLFFKTNDIPDVLPVLPSARKLLPPSKRSSREKLVPMPIIQETFTLASSSKERSDLTFKAQNMAQVVRSKQQRTSLECNEISVQVNNNQPQIRIKHPCELNTLNAQSLSVPSVSNHWQSKPMCPWPRPEATDQEPQPKIQKLLNSSATNGVSIKMNPKYILASKITPSSKVKFMPTITMSQLLQMKGNSIESSAQKNTSNTQEIRILKPAPTTRVVSNKSLLRTNTAQAKSSLNSNEIVSPTVPFMSIVPLTLTKVTTDETFDVKKNVSKTTY